ncbi:MAG: dihydrodipicolinate synthase family protein [Chloroflexi bacterium]|jgi:4-hydroxy-tetrahydrodipicolinate synthase|nr:dihydrodipicolinate synthase family protein [Chloroflexota bacterium]
MGKEIKGIVVPVVTPFRQDESINEDALRQIVNYLVGAGVHGLFPSGSQGEFWALTTDEKKRVMDVVIEEADGRVFVMPSTGAVTTRESIELTRHAERSGADAVSVITPFFIRPSADELRRHYVAIANSVSIPVLAYSNPDRTSLPITPAVAAAIAREAGNFAGIKDSSGDLTNTMAYIEECPPHFRTFMGRDTLIYAGLVYGCVGAVAATANVAPELVVGIYDAFMAGDRDLALQRQRRLAPLRRAFTLGSFPVVVKDAMELMGLPAGPCRAPIRSLEGQARQTLIAILRDMGKLQ